MKRVMVLGVIFSMAFCLLAENGVASNKPVILKAASPWPKTHDNNTIFFRFCGMVEKKTNGEVKIQWAGGPELFKARDLPTVAAAGSIDVFHYPFGYLGGKIPDAGIYDAYPGNRDYGNISTVHREALKFLAPLCEDKLKIKPFGTTTVFPFYLWTRKPIHTFEDMKGLKVRVHGGLAPHLIRALGMSVVTMPSTDVYMALERGVIDGALRNLSSFFNFREFEFCKFGVNIPLHVGGTPIFISLRKWAKLNQAQRAAFAEAGEQTIDSALKFWKKKNQEFIDKLKSHGVTLLDPAPEFKARWQKAMAEAGRKAALKMSPKGGEKMIELIETYSR